MTIRHKNESQDRELRIDFLRNRPNLQSEFRPPEERSHGEQRKAADLRKHERRLRRVAVKEDTQQQVKEDVDG